jgi:hypothetical protein
MGHDDTLKDENCHGAESTMYFWFDRHIHVWKPPSEISTSIARKIFSPEERRFCQGLRSNPSGLGLDKIDASGTVAGVMDVRETE